MTATLQFVRDANAGEDATEPRHSTGDDAGMVPGVGASCDNCGFLRIHLVQAQALLD
jgi:hypothetical protein